MQRKRVGRDGFDNKNECAIVMSDKILILVCVSLSHASQAGQSRGVCPTPRLTRPRFKVGPEIALDKHTGIHVL